MIGKLKGIIDEINDDHCVMDVNGVGYVAFCSLRTLSTLSSVGASEVLLVETHVREDMIRLFGFHTTAEREWFRLLISHVQGVGARLALAILSILSPSELAMAVASRDLAMISRVPGVGKKVAGRIVSELHSKVLPCGEELTDFKRALGDSFSAPVSDALSALVNLGYSRDIASNAVAAAQKIAGDNADSSLLIKLGLKEISAL